VILLTVGTQLPFDRLVAAVDNISPRLGEKVIATIGKSKYVPANIEWSASLPQAAHERILSDCRLIVSHAGIGSVLAAQRHRKPIILFPRRAAFGEHRSDHQLSTCVQLRGKQGLYVAEDIPELERLIFSADLIPASNDAHTLGRADFAARLRSFLSGAPDAA
jgi:UDP-N-acetylglucosamine transferase subunit ALG13